MIANVTLVKCKRRTSKLPSSHYTFANVKREVRILTEGR